MRRILHKQLGLVSRIEHTRGKELVEMSNVLDQMPEVATLVHGALVAAGGDPDKGREAMTAEQVLRAMIIKQLNGFSYDQLAFHLADSSSFRSFCRFALGNRTPSKSTLQRNIKCVPADVWERTNRFLVGHAQVRGVERGDKLRADCTVVESNIHEPTDSSLLWDCVRVLSRLMVAAREEFGTNFVNHRRRARRRSLGILNAKRMEQRVPLYRDLIRVTELTLSDARKVADSLDDIRAFDPGLLLRAKGIATEIRHYLPIAERVVNQTIKRVLRGETVASSEKIVSIFEAHTDVIVKDRRDTLYGHKVCLTSGASGMVIDLVVESGNPADSTLATKMVARARNVIGKVARQFAFDGGFSSKRNVEKIKALGTQDVAFAKHLGLEIEDMVRSKWVFKKLRNFRAGIEGVISFLKRGFGLDRCTWKGWPAFRSYTWGSVVAFNLLTFARHLLPSA